MNAENRALSERNSGRVDRSTWRSSVPYLVTGAAVWLICQLVARTSWSSHGGIRGLMYDWMYIHALPLGFLEEVMPQWVGQTIGRPGARLVQLASFCAVSLILWLLTTRFAFTARFRPWPRAICAWLALELAYILLFVGLVSSGLVRD